MKLSWWIACFSGNSKMMERLETSPIAVDKRPIQPKEKASQPVKSKAVCVGFHFGALVILQACPGCSNEAIGKATALFFILFYSDLSEIYITADSSISVSIKTLKLAFRTVLELWRFCRLLNVDCICFPCWDACDGMGAATQGYSLDMKYPYQKGSYAEGLFLG